MGAHEAGYAVSGVDIDPERVEALRSGHSPTEDVRGVRLQSALDGGYRAFTLDDELPPFNVAVIAVPTPVHEARPDLTAIETAARVIGDALAPKTLVVLESTTYPGTTSELVVPILTERSGLPCGDEFLVGCSLERIDPGNTVFTLADTPKIISGVDSASLEATRLFYGALVRQRVPVARPGGG